MKGFRFLLMISLTCASLQRGRDGKLFPVFQVVRFPNDPCYVGGGSKNGTCYTAEECSNKGGNNIGSCAQGFGVCCTFTIGCGATSSENQTYFDSTNSPSAGECRAKICKCGSNICQIRLDFHSFIITGPSTLTQTVAETLGGAISSGGAAVHAASQCQTDLFTVSNQNTFPKICGTNSGYHAYFEASDACNSLDFQLGSTANGVTALATRAWSIKVTQIECDSTTRAPSGCTQWFYGPTGSGLVESFNYASATKHLADQRQTICIRRESGNCRICWSSVGTMSVDISLAIASVNVNHDDCCDYGTNGQAALGWDCLIIPGAVKADDNSIVSDRMCAKSFGLGTATQTDVANIKTICSKETPFRIQFLSDPYEVASEAGKGFQLHYTQTSC